MSFKFEKTPLEDVILIENKKFGDERGYFMETYNNKNFVESGIDTVFMQDNQSKSQKWVLRGLHFQAQNTQAKLVRVINGTVFDVAVDLREKSKSFGYAIGVILSAENNKQLFVPKGFAHWFISLEDDTVFAYKCDDLYNPQAESGINRNSPNLSRKSEDIQTICKNYNLEIKNLIISNKDKLLADFNKSNKYF